MHIHCIEDENGELVNIAKFCSNSCHRDYCIEEGLEYDGWNGAHETEFTDWCVRCGVVLPGQDACECQTRNIAVNCFLVDEPERCEHGNLMQAVR